MVDKSFEVGPRMNTLAQIGHPLFVHQLGLAFTWTGPMPMGGAIRVRGEEIIFCYYVIYLWNIPFPLLSN